MSHTYGTKWSVPFDKSLYLKVFHMWPCELYCSTVLCLKICVSSAFSFHRSKNFSDWRWFCMYWYAHHCYMVVETITQHYDITSLSNIIRFISCYVSNTKHVQWCTLFTESCFSTIYVFCKQQLKMKIILQWANMLTAFCWCVKYMWIYGKTYFKLYTYWVPCQSSKSVHCIWNKC